MRRGARSDRRKTPRRLDPISSRRADRFHQNSEWPRQCSLRHCFSATNWTGQNPGRESRRRSTIPVDRVCLSPPPRGTSPITGGRNAETVSDSINRKPRDTHPLAYPAACRQTCITNKDETAWVAKCGVGYHAESPRGRVSRRSKPGTTRRPRHPPLRGECSRLRPRGC